MDGYAIRAADTAAATEDEPVELRVIGDIAAGAAPDVTVEPGTAARIATGARLPDGADAVVPVELTTPLDAAGDAQARAVATRPGRCRPPASSTKRSSPAARSAPQAATSRPARRSSRPGPRSTARPWRSSRAPASTRLLVHRRPRIAVLATGDEVRAPGQPLGPAGIPDANGPGLRALVTAAGGEADRPRHRHRRPRRRPDAAPRGPRRRRRRR